MEQAVLEILSKGAIGVHSLSQDRVTIGFLSDNELALPLDKRVSRHHAVLERVGSGWVIRDLGSTNGTFVNGRRVWTDHTLENQDEIQVGDTRLLFRGTGSAEASGQTQGGAGPVALTRREHEVLIALCRPAIEPDVFTLPSSIRNMASTLFITEAAVKQHLLNLYLKFGIREAGDEGRRVRLANEVIRRGAISIAELRMATS
jgi:pSer/pThr/pTyr-binding forkhead associated (FHA) protein